MPEASRCWVCHRSEEEISAMVDIETPQEREILQQISQVSRFRTKFIESADLWRKGIPKEFKEMDFKFVAANADQFSSIRVLGEIVDAKRLMVDWLVGASAKLRKGDGELPSLSALSPLEKADSEFLVRMMDQFEAKWHRRLVSDAAKGVDSRGYQSGFDGLKLLDGLEFVIAGGALYYDVQSQLLDMARRKAINSKPKRSVSAVQVNGYPPVPLCSVCVGLIKELRAPQSKEAEPAAPEQAQEEPQPQTVNAVQMAAVTAAATAGAIAAAEEAATADMVADAPPQVAEIIKKIGPATKEAPKMRSLHEHRAKEEWDEVLAKDAQKGE
jgi:hypothetical protein